MTAIAPKIDAITLPLRRFTVDEYHRMIESGVLPPDEAIELLEGLVVPKMTRNPPHDAALELAEDLIRRCLPEGWRVRIQSAITTPDSEPEPDLVIVRGPARNRRTHHPGPDELALVMEIADATLARDRTEKARIYARAGIIRYWILNLIDNQIETHGDPTGPDLNPHYRTHRVFTAEEEIPLIVGGQEVARLPVAEFVP